MQHKSRKYTFPVLLGFYEAEDIQILISCYFTKTRYYLSLKLSKRQFYIEIKNAIYSTLEIPILGLNYTIIDAKKLKDDERKNREDDETNYLIKAIWYTISKPGFLCSRDNPLPANWGVPRLMSEERRAKRCETKRRGLTKNLERRLRESRVEIIRFVRFLSLCTALF